MKTSVVVADKTFRGNTAPLLGSYEDVTRQAAEIGFDAIQLTVNRPKEVSIAPLLQAAEKHGLAISSIATGLGYSMDGLSLGHPDRANREQAVQRMIEHIQLATELGNPLVIIGAIRGWAKENSSWSEFEEYFTDSVKRLLDEAVKKDITLILEANDHLETDAYLSVAETAAFIQRFQCPNFKLHLDSMHLLYEKQDTYQEILNYASLIAQVDISDEDRMAPDGKHFDFPTMIKALKEINYSNYLVFEYRSAPPVGAAKLGFDYIRSLI